MVMANVTYINDLRFGATPETWAHFDLILGLTEDLLPVVSNTKAMISPTSSMSELGKTPSCYNRQRRVIGIAQWTQKQATPDEIEAWAKEKDLGICIQTRRVRAIDVDVTDPDLARRIREFIDARFSLPARIRDNAPKFLLAFEYTGELYKRRFKTEHGIVELLATGQQFVAAGRHTSGVRYEWEAGLPDAFPVLTLPQLDALWSDLAREFAVETPTESGASTRAEKLTAAAENDPVAQYLVAQHLVKKVERDGRLHIDCPWQQEHTTETGESSTTYWPAHTGGYANGHFKCLHAHCEHRTDEEFKEALGYIDQDVLAEFDVITDEPAPDVEAETPKERGRFAVIPAHEFIIQAPATYLIKKIIPQAELVVLFGESASGKTFMALDLAMAVAIGAPWRGHKVQQGRVVYIAAEGAGGVRRRLQAYAVEYGVNLADIPLGVINAAPNLLQKPEALEVAKEIGRGVALVIIDTFAQTMPGGNENSGEDVGKALAHCKGIHRATGAVVMMVHHSGKDSTKGARGWSGLRAAADAELEVVRAEEARAMTVTKQKDGEDGLEFAFKLKSVLLGEDSDGEPLTSCVVEHAEGGRPVAKKGPRGAVEKLVIKVLEDLTGLTGERIGIAELKENVKNELIFDPADGRRDTRAQRVGRALESLIEAGRIQIIGAHVVLVSA